LNIIVCVKQVIDTAASIKFQNGAVDMEGLPRVLNPYDEFAVEEAVRIKEKNPETQITLLTLGPQRFKDALKTGLAMGADRAVHLLDPVFTELDSLGVAHALAQAARLIGFDLVLCGRQAVDDDMACIGPAMAVFLNIPCISVVTRLECSGETAAVVTRQVEGGSEVCETPLPCLLTCQKGLNEPRLPSLKGIMAARKKEVNVMDAATIGFDTEAFGPASNRIVQIDLSPPPVRDKGMILEGSPQDACAQLVKLLREDRKVI
jgi:electron transfer flavoprotein beta subunit